MKLFGRQSSEQPRHVTLGGRPLRRENETTHVLLVGSTGTGKSTLTAEVMDTVVGRGERCIVVDANGHFLERFFKTGDVVLNPFDRRCPGWSIFNELEDVYDADRLARCTVPDGVGEDRAWNGYAQVLLAEILQALFHQRRATAPTTAMLLHWATQVETAELKDRLEGTPAMGLFTAGSERALASTRFILTRYLNPHKHLPRGTFSLRRWLHCGRGNLFMTWRSEQLSSLQPLLGTWIEILVDAILSLPPAHDRRVWLILEELGALPQLRLESAVTLGRKNGLACVAALQSTAQLERIYGRDAASILRSCFRTLAVLSIAPTDPDTAETMSRSLGEREIDLAHGGRSLGYHGLTRTESVQRVRERLVLPGELTQLPDLRGYLAMPGSQAIQPITLERQARRVLASSFEPRPAC